MTFRRWGIVLIAIPMVVLAAEEAPPAELLENLDFFQHFELVQDDQFLTQASRDEMETPGDLDVESSSGPASMGGGSHENDL